MEFQNEIKMNKWFRDKQKEDGLKNYVYDHTQVVIDVEGAPDGSQTWGLI